MANSSELTDLVKRAAQANAKFYQGWMQLYLDYARGLTEAFAGAAANVTTPPIQEMDAGAGALVLEGEAGSVVRGSFLVSNDMDKTLSCRFVGSEFRDPTGALVSAQAAFDPTTVQLAPGAEQVVQVSIAVDQSLVAGVGHAGEITISGMDGYAVPIVLRRQHTINDDSPIQQPPTPAPPTPAEPAVNPKSARSTKTSPKSAKRRSR